MKVVLILDLKSRQIKTIYEVGLTLLLHFDVIFLYVYVYSKLVKSCDKLIKNSNDSFFNVYIAVDLCNQLAFGRHQKYLVD